jgi:hypothetical protein
LGGQLRVAALLFDQVLREADAFGHGEFNR